jgi:hypothetical protein
MKKLLRVAGLSMMHPFALFLPMLRMRGMRF